MIFYFIFALMTSMYVNPAQKDLAPKKPRYPKTAILSTVLLPELIAIVQDYLLPECYWKKLSTSAIISDHQFNHDCTQIITHHGESTDVYDIQSDEKLNSIEFDFEDLPRRQLHPDGTLWRVNDGILSTYDRISKQFQKLLLSGQERKFHSIKLSQHGTYAGIQRDGGFDIIVTRTKKILNSINIPNPSSIRSFCFSADESVCAFEDDRATVALYNLTKNEKKPHQILKGHEDDISSIMFSKDNARVLTSSWDHTVRLWDSKTGTIIQTYHHPDWVCNAQFGPAEAWIVSGGIDGYMRFFDTQSGSLLSEYFQRDSSARFGKLALSDNGTTVAARDCGSIHYFLNPITYLQRLAAQQSSLEIAKTTGRQKKRKREKEEN